MSYRLHKFVLALCVTACLAVSMWPRRPSLGPDLLPPAIELGHAREELRSGPRPLPQLHELGPQLLELGPVHASADKHAPRQPGSLVQRAASIGP